MKGLLKNKQLFKIILRRIILILFCSMMLLSPYSNIFWSAIFMISFLLSILGVIFDIVEYKNFKEIKDEKNT